MQLSFCTQILHCFLDTTLCFTKVQEIRLPPRTTQNPLVLPNLHHYIIEGQGLKMVETVDQEIEYLLLGYGQNIQSGWNINAAEFKIFIP